VAGAAPIAPVLDGDDLGGERDDCRVINEPRRRA